MASQFIIGKDRQSINRTVAALGWRTAGRASWVKPDGTEVHYLHFAEQIAAVTFGDTVHIVGAASEMISALKFSGAFIVKGAPAKPTPPKTFELRGANVRWMV